MASPVDYKSVTTVRSLVVDAVERANHGHMGAPLGSAPMGYELFRHHMRHNPTDPTWFDRDRFILTGGHASMLLYALLHLCGYDLTMDDLKTFRQLGSRCPGHPEYGHTPGVEATTGPLGQGFAMTVGMAVAEAHLADRFNRPGFNVIDHDTYTICGDGDLEEGVAMEAAAIAGKLGLGRLTVLYDSNDVTSDGPLTKSDYEDVLGKFRAMNWNTIYVDDGNDLDKVAAALIAAKAETSRPTIIEVKNIIGYGSTKQGTCAIHSNAQGPEEAAHIKKAIGCDWSPFTVPDDVREGFAGVAEKGAADQVAWNDLVARYGEAFPEEAAELARVIAGDWSVGAETLERFEGGKMATRSASGKVLNRLYKGMPVLVGGSADLASSNKTTIEGLPFMDETHHEGPNIHFGIREFAMAGIVNGITLHGGLRGYCGTFLVFSDYMRSAIRLAALMGAPTTFIMTHDSLQVGQDGPTHQPVEHLVSLRAMPNLVVYRAADANEVIAGWKLAAESKDRPYLLALGRHDVPVLAEASLEGAQRGAYVISKDADEPELIIIATGSEVEMALAAKEKLSGHSVNVVSVPSWELFDEQDEAYRESVLPTSVKARLSVEMGSTIGWERFVGERGATFGNDRFGASAPAADILESYGFTVDAIVDAAYQVIAKNA